MENLWKSFIDLFSEPKLDYSTDNEVETSRQNVKKWTEEFPFCIKQVMSPHVCMVLKVHVPEFLELYKKNFSAASLIRN